MAKWYDPTTWNNPGDWFSEQWDRFSGKDAAQSQADAIASAAEKDQAYNFPNVEGVLGGQTVVKNPDGTITLRQNLSDQQRALVDSLYGDIGTGRQSVEDALYSRATSRLDPQWGDRESSVEAKLYNQGLRPGDEAYDRAMRDLEFARTDAYQAARDQATAQGGAEENRLISALMAASNPGLQSYWGKPNATDSAIAQANLMAGVPSGLDAILGIAGLGVKAAGK